MTDPATPVIVGVGEVMRHWAVADGVAAAPSPHGLRVEAAARALADAGGGALRAAIDRIVVLRTMLDSMPAAPQPFGRSDDPPAALGAALGLGATDGVYSAVGGDQPQSLVHEACATVARGEARAVLIATAEATVAMKAALRGGVALDWSAGSVTRGEGAFDDRGLGADLLTRAEIAGGMGAPTITYPLFEHALARRWGHDRAQHRAAIAALWAEFSAVASSNPYAQFPEPRDAAFLSTPSPENYPVADPYLKWDVAQDAVNQGAAVIVTSVAAADRCGIAPDRRVYLHGHAEARDATPSARPDLSRSAALEHALPAAIERAGLRSVEEIAHLDLYSCFPVAVFLAAEALGIDVGDGHPSRPLTLTGGLPFFGGAGNGYSLHAIAAMARRLRAEPTSFGLVHANGGFLSKQAVGVYSARPPATPFVPADDRAGQARIDAQPAPPLVAEGEGRLESFTVAYDRGVPSRGTAVVRTDADERILARTAPGDVAKLAALTRDGLADQRLRVAADARGYPTPIFD